MAKSELNFRGMSCPMPIMKMAMALKKASSGDVFEAVADDPAFEADIRAWTRETGNILESVTKEGKETIAVIVKK